MDGIGFIYGVLHPDTAKVCYVGKTVRTIEHRMKGHYTGGSFDKPTYFDAWYKLTVDKGQTPKTVLLETVYDLDKINDIESYWIGRFESRLPIMNAIKGYAPHYGELFELMAITEIHYPENVISLRLGECHSEHDVYNLASDVWKVYRQALDTVPNGVFSQETIQAFLDFEPFYKSMLDKWVSLGFYQLYVIEKLTGND